jgi:hypothetical protein
MINLYLGDYLKKDKVQEALHSAKIKGKLKEVSDLEVETFVEEFLKVAEERHYKYGDKLSHFEVVEILNIMERDHTDIIDGGELDTIRDILSDKHFVF